MFFPLHSSSEQIKKQPLEIAYTARYYYQGKRSSTFHLYLSSLDGKLKHQITPNVTTVGDFIWLDRNHLAYVEVDQKQQGPKSTPKDTYKLISFDISTSQTRVLSQFASKETKWTFDGDHRTIKVDNTTYRITPKEVHKVEADEEVGSGEFGETSTMTQDQPYIAKVPAHGDSPEYGLEWLPQWPEEYDHVVPVKITKGETTKEFKLGPNTIRWAFSIGPNHLILNMDPMFKKFDCEASLIDIDFNAERSSVLVSGAGYLEADLNRSWWMGTQPEGSPLAALNDGRQVYVRWLYAGDWKQKKKWTIATGLVYVDNYKFRPVN